MPAADTSAKADSVQLQAQRNLGGSGRLLLALDMSLATRALALAGIRAEHPDWSDDKVMRHWLRGLFPPDRIPPPLR